MNKTKEYKAVLAALWGFTGWALWGLLIVSDSPLFQNPNSPENIPVDRKPGPLSRNKKPTALKIHCFKNTLFLELFARIFHCQVRVRVKACHLVQARIDSLLSAKPLLVQHHGQGPAATSLTTAGFLYFWEMVPSVLVGSVKTSFLK